MKSYEKINCKKKNKKFLNERVKTTRDVEKVSRARLSMCTQFIGVGRRWKIISLREKIKKAKRRALMETHLRQAHHHVCLADIAVNIRGEEGEQSDGINIKLQKGPIRELHL